MAYSVTPYKVSGDVDYQKLIKEFGLKPIDKGILNRLIKFTKESHYMLRKM